MFATVACLTASLVLTNASQVARACRARTLGVPFELRCTVTYPLSNGGSLFAAEDDTDAILLHANQDANSALALAPGDIVDVSGGCDRSLNGHGLARCKTIRKIGHVRPRAPQDVNAETLKSGAVDGRMIRIRGIVREVFLDEIDSGFIFLVLCCGRDTVYAACNARRQSLSDFKKLTGADISIVGLCSDNDVGTRGQIGHLVDFKGRKAVEIHELPPDDPFLAPLLSDMKNLEPEQVSITGRRRLVGKVLATWSDSHALLVDGSDALHTAEFSGEKTPFLGDTIEAVGMPETDLYRINLSSATWRPYRGAALISNNLEQASFKSLHTDEFGRPCINPLVHGKVTTCIGNVLETSSGPNGSRILTLKVGDRTVPVDVSDVPDAFKAIAVGCTMQISGICIVETETWRPYAQFPHAKGITIVPRTDADIRILSRPPWWTPGRLLVVIGSLLAALLGILVWNRILNRLVERRSRELLREQAARVGDRLKVGERTRLAVELHDSLSQTLTGVSFQIDAAEQARRKDPSQVGKFLAVAKQTLQSCREELRNCLWDLRNNALEETDAEVAIRKTVEPQIGEAELAVDFKVPRHKLTDNTFHAILCIVRELAVNAARHGKAGHISISGEIKGGRLTFAVTDDGCGFDPDRHPGVDEGHFGLLGIAERIETHGGALDIRSSPGNGTKVTFSISP